MTSAEFIKMYKRKRAEDLISEFMKEVVCISPVSVDCPKDYFIRFEHYGQLSEYFFKIRNSPVFVPGKGDICIWGSGVNNGIGKACIATGRGNTKRFFCIDLNRRGKIRIKKCNYKFFLGVLRVK